MSPISATHRALIVRLFEQAACARWHVESASFEDALERSAARRFREQRPGTAELSEYFKSLHVTDLALALGCAAGDEGAWEHFVREYRPKLYAAASAIAGAAGARDLADSLYAELYGLDERDGRRRSLFEYFHGRSTLATWLRAVLSQRFIDATRVARRTESLDDPDAVSRDERRTDPSDPERERYVALLHAALTTALAGLPPRDRLRLSYYYAHDLTLAQIGRLLGEHESTASRHLDRTRRAIRRAVEDTLRIERRLTEPQVQLCFEYALDEWPFDVRTALSEPKSS